VLTDVLSDHLHFGRKSVGNIHVNFRLKTDARRSVHKIDVRITGRERRGSFDVANARHDDASVDNGAGDRVIGMVVMAAVTNHYLGPSLAKSLDEGHPRFARIEKKF